jgi:hypothetical protein
MEKGIREELKGLKPHSKGDIFSRSNSIFFDKKEEINITIKEIKKNKILKINRLKIIYIKIFKPYDWKSCILYILYKFILSSSSINRNIQE